MDKIIVKALWIPLLFSLIVAVIILTDMIKPSEEIFQPVEFTAVKENANNFVNNSYIPGPPTLTPTPTPSPTFAPAPVDTGSNWWDYPKEIIVYDKSAVNLTTVVSKRYALPSDYIPADLIGLPATIPSLKNEQISAQISNPLQNLFTAAQAEGHTLAVVSAYRSYATQAQTYQYWVSYNGSQAAADRISARAGHSEHQLGTTVDISSLEVNYQIGSIFHNTSAAAWLKNNAYKYGFTLSYPSGKETITGFSHESWHYRYVGIETASQLYVANQTLIESIE